MKKESMLKQEYRDLKCQNTPMLWDRIETNLKEHPERIMRNADKTTPQSQWRTFSIAGAAAAFLLVISLPWHVSRLRSNSSGTEEKSYYQYESTQPVSQETDSETTQKNQDFTSQGVLYYSQLNLTEYESLSLPTGAVTVSEDSAYFSEALLRDTQLLCLGTVASVTLETNENQQTAFLVYDVVVDSVNYSEDYVTDLTRLTIKSPIVRAIGQKNEILYQLQKGETYLLPLKKQAESWELLFPFAPQIQKTENGAYLFHSGYNSLIDDQTSVVVMDQEGSNDFYYDRMLLRNDDTFLSDYLSLIMH